MTQNVGSAVGEGNLPKVKYEVKKTFIMFGFWVSLVMIVALLIREYVVQGMS